MTLLRVLFFFNVLCSLKIPWSLSILIFWLALIFAFQLNSLGPLFILAHNKLVFPGVLGSTFFFSFLSDLPLSNLIHFHGLHHYFMYWRYICFEFQLPISISKSEPPISLGITSAAQHHLIMFIEVV